MSLRLALLVALPFVAALPACSGSAGSATPCTSATQCPAGQACVAGFCTAGDGGLRFPDLGNCEAGGARCASTCCTGGQVCRLNHCMDKPPSCAGDKDCQNDTYCEGGECLPWSLNPKGPKNESCSYVIPPGLFSPTKLCSWSGPPAGDAFPNHKNVLGTPTVADFKLDPSSTVKQPSVVFVSYDYTDGGSEASACANGYFGVVRVIDGRDCKQQFTVSGEKVRASSPLALGDLDGDGRPEIVAARCGGGLVAFRYDVASKSFVVHWTSSPSDLGASVGMWDGPAIHDLDDDGKPEILLSGTVWDSSGKLLDGSLGLLPISAGYLPVAADLDGDGVIELADGSSVWKWKGGKWTLFTSAAALAPGQVAVADFGTFGTDAAKDNRAALDGIAEIAVVSQGTVRVQTIDGRVVFGPVAIPSGGTGGAPTIGDFDRDGRAEVAAAGSDSYSVFDPDCIGAPQATTCPTQTTAGVLWTKVSQDHSSNVTGSSIFDFDGDGTAEAVYADECFTRVYEGKTGEVIFSQYRSSCTWYENPIVADVNGDFKSELVVPSNTNCAIGAACTSNPNLDKHPVSGLTLDPLFKGLRCKAASDCLGGSCDSGFCRCQTDQDCGGGGFVCGPPVAGTPGSGQVCRAAFLGQIGGLFIYHDVLDRWVNSRMIWNQHPYAVTNVNDDGTVPRTSLWKQNWKQAGLNNFRQNVQGALDPTAAPDLTASAQTTLPCDSTGMTLKIKLCNRGTKPVGAGTPVTFYLGDPSTKEVACTGKSSVPVSPGDCVEVSCVWTKAPHASPVDVTAVADDDGTGKGTTNECEEGNNRALLKGVVCSTIQ